MSGIRIQASIAGALFAWLVAATAQGQLARTAIHPDVIAAQQAIDESRGPEVYSALRRLWATWATARPEMVEEALREVVADRTRTAPVRAYAKQLLIQARRRRGDLTGAARLGRELGVVNRWQILGPFDDEGKAGLDRSAGPELEVGRPRVPGHAYQGKERLVRWRAVTGNTALGWLDLGAFLRPDEKICAFATTYVRSRDIAKVHRMTAWIGVMGAFKVLWNGQEVLKDKAYRGFDSDRYATTVDLEPGYNDLTIKVCGESHAPVLSVRFTDEHGEATKSLEWTNDPAAGQDAAKAVRKPGGARPSSRAGEVLGPMQLFSGLTGKRAGARELHGFARYLAATGGDDPVTHQARNLITKAVAIEPTIPRLLLGARLAEDHNRSGEWLARAQNLKPRDQHERMSLLLARASHARNSTTWRSSIPIYDEAIRLVPDDVRAVRGKVEVLNEAGLQRSALAVIETALLHSPDAVLLVSMYASQLRTLGRETDAEAAENRYGALRFDDPSLLGQRLELAGTRRQKNAVNHWADRLVGLDPTSQWGLHSAARAQRTAGSATRAIELHQRALDLAPEDVGALERLASLHGELGARDKQIPLLRRILEVRPQARQLREYLEHLDPPKARFDEALAWEPQKFLYMRHAPHAGQGQRRLRDLSVHTVFENGLSSTFRQVVFQPLTAATAASARQYAFVYQADRQSVQLRGARVFRGNGQVDEAVESGEGSADNPDVSIYTSSRAYYVQFPRLEPGDVVELRYRIDDFVASNDFADYFGDEYHPQASYPSANVEYVVAMPKKRELFLESNLPGLERSVRVEGQRRIYRLFAKTIAPVPYEPAMPPMREALGFIHASTYRTWSDLGRWYWGLARDQFDLDDETRKLARKIGEKARTDADKVKAVFGWVVKNTRYVGLEFGIDGFKPRRCVQTVTRGWGDCKDKATVIVSLLRELGVKANIVIVRTRNQGRSAAKIPSLALFDHAIAYVPSLNLYLDGTASFSGSRELPAADHEALGLIVDENQVKLVTLPVADPDQNRIERKLRVDLARDGAAAVELESAATGFAAPGWRHRYHSEATRRERLTADFGSNVPGFEIAAGKGAVTTTDLSDYEQPVNLKIRGKSDRYARREGQTLSVGVTSEPELTQRFASLSMRQQDVELGPMSSHHDLVTVRLPVGAKVRKLPTSEQGRTTFGSFSLEVESKGNTVTVKSYLRLDKTRVTRGDYDAFRRFCADVDRVFGQRLVVAP